MRQGIRLLATLLAALLPGCLEYEQTVTLERDGSGTQKVALGMGERVLGEVRRATAMQPVGAADPLLVFDKAAVEKEFAGTGMALTAHATKTTGGKRRVDLQASFPNLAALRQSPLNGNGAEWAFGPGPQPGTIEATFYPRGKAAWTEAAQKAEKQKGQTDAVAAEFFKKRQAELQGLDLTFRMTVPGEVVLCSRNLEKTGPREVTARITAASIQTTEDLVLKLAPRFRVIFVGAGCTFPLDGK